jgi:hypothetical protein
MNQPIDYLGAAQSTFNAIKTFHQKSSKGIRITRVAWVFYLHQASQTSKSNQVLLANSSVAKKHLNQAKLTVDDEAFPSGSIANPFSELTIPLENALSAYLEILEASQANADYWTLAQSQITIAFILNPQNQVEFSRSLRGAKNNAIHQLTFTIQAI